MNISKTTATHESKAIVFAFNVRALSQYVHRSISLHSQYIGLGFFSYAILCVCVCNVYAVCSLNWNKNTRWFLSLAKRYCSANCILVLFTSMDIEQMNRRHMSQSNCSLHRIIFICCVWIFFFPLDLTLCQFCWPLDFEIWASKSTMSISLHVFPSV